MYFQQISGTPVLVSAATQQTLNFRANMATVPGTKPFFDIYQSYRIVRVTYIFTLVSTNVVNDLQGASGSILDTKPILYTAVVRSGVDYPTTVPEILSMNSCKWRVAPRSHVRSYIPCTFDLVSDPLVQAGTSLNPEWKQWLPTSSYQVYHHGMTAILTGLPNTNPASYQYNVTTRYTVQFRNRKPNTEINDSLSQYQGFEKVELLDK